MATFDAFNFATGKNYMNFDIVQATIDGVKRHLESTLKEYEKESETCSELHVPTPFNPDMDAHIHDPYGEAIEDVKELLARCRTAKGLVEEARDTVMDVVAEMP